MKNSKLTRIISMGGVLRIEAPPNLLQGSHRIFFVNVLRFDINDRFGYVSPNTATPETLATIISYLKENDFKFTLNPESESLVAQFRNDATLIKEARSIGDHLKQSPPKTITIPGLRRPLKPYQVPSVSHIVQIPNSANFSVPGSGKTGIVLAAFALLRQQKQIDKIVVIGPRAAFMPWEEEYVACFKQRASSIRITGSKSTRKHLYRMADSKNLILLSYHMANNDTESLIGFLKRHKVMLVLDESHNIKRLEGGHWADALLSVAPYATKRVILTGTPAPHSLYDLWTQITFLWPNSSILGSRDQFKFQVDSQGDKFVPVLKDELHPFYWRIRKHDLALPRPIYKRIQLKMKPYQTAIYSTLAAKVLAEITKSPEERIRLRQWRKARMVRLLQAASNPSLLNQYSAEFRIPPLDASGLPVDQLIEKYPEYEMPVKLEYAVKLTRELCKKGHKVLIWTSFVHNIKMLKTLLHKLNPSVVYGEIPKDDDDNEQLNREKMIRDFKTSPKHMVLIANPGACAESVSLHKICHHAIYIDRTFNGAQYMQSLDRIHRLGLTANERVYYYFLQASNTIDNVIDSRLGQKLKRMLDLLDDEFAVLSLDTNTEDFSEATEEDADFDALIKQLKKQVEIQRK